MQNWVTACHGRWQLYDHNAMHSNIENLRKEYLISKCEEKKNSCSKITMTSNIQVLRKEMSTIFKDINTFFMEMLHNLKGLGISYLAYIIP